MKNITCARPRLLQLPWFVLIVSVLVLLRFLHMGEFVDEPYSWIQADRACHALNFYRDGINILKPSTCFLGAYKTLVLNFPLTEVIVALGYLMLGGPNIIYTRFVTLSFYLGSALYLFAIVRYLCNLRLARLTLLVYLVLPLGLFWSRAAVHIDFPTVFFSHAMLYYMLRGYDENKTSLILLSSILGTLAFLIKAPYAFYLFLPFGFHIITHLKIKPLLKWSPLFVIPVISFLLWRYHAETTNALAPDWSFIPGYFKYINLGGWFYGPLAQRFSPDNWLILGNRFLIEVTSPLGFYLFILGLFIRPSETRSITFFRLWLIGLLVYLLIFFNLNVVHNYYQIPFLAISSFFIAVSLDSIFIEKHPRLLIITVLLLVANCLWIAERLYYAIDWVKVSAGSIIRQYTPEDSLLIASISMISTGWADPRLLGEAQRNGWPTRISDLSQSLVQALVDEGAEYLAIVSNQPIPTDIEAFLIPYPQETFVLSPIPTPRVTVGEYRDWICTNGDWQLYLYALNGADFLKSGPVFLGLEDWSLHDVRRLDSDTPTPQFQVTGNDPILSSPALNLKAKDYNHVIVEALIPPPVDCSILTLYFTTTDAPVESESRAIHLPFHPSEKSLNFVINARAHPEWRGVITHLRIDPVCGLNSDGPAIKFKVESVALQK